MEAADSPSLTPPGAPVAAATATQGRPARVGLGASADPARDTLGALVRDLARLAAADAWRATDGAISDPSRSNDDDR